MDPTPFVTINPQSPTSPGRHQLSPLSPIQSGFTPMILCTNSYGMQILTPLPIFAVEISIKWQFHIVFCLASFGRDAADGRYRSN